MKFKMKIIAILIVLFSMASDVMAQVRVTIGSHPRPVYRHYVYRPHYVKPYYGYGRGHYKVHHWNRDVYHDEYYDRNRFHDRGYHRGHR